MESTSLKVRLVRLSRPTKRLITVISDCALVASALAAALLLTYPTQPELVLDRWYLFLVALGVCVPVFSWQGLYRAVIRFIGARMVFAVLRSITLVMLATVAADIVLSPASGVEVLSTGLVFWAFGLLAIAGDRFLVRMFLLRQTDPVERVAVYGAGEAGARLVSSLAAGREFAPVAIVDDNHALQGRSVNGIEVHHPDLLPQLAGELGITRVLLALPSVGRRKRQRIIANLESMPVHVQTIPDIGDLVSGVAQVDEIRDVDVADLLGRDPVPPHDRLLDACIHGKSVIVTGAGGSIGSELCRQIIQLGPRRLLLFEISESALYEIERELLRVIDREGLDVEIVALLGSVTHRARMRDVLRTFKVDTLYHAAAYKHVPMVEHNMIEGINNNILGTWETALAAQDAGVETFVLISTDKAVSPVNVMGATKRFSELVLQGLAEKDSDTRFCMVRFGNVLASSGSVVPLFREQIQRGGPVTVTHPEIIRYFMTIPEAAQLVIQAGSMGRGGDVFVLDMGRPVRIEDLARKMVHLMGLTVRDEDNPDGDVAIAYTGLRPAEKLYEELLIGNNVMGTEHPMIMRAIEESLDSREIQGYVEQIKVAAERFDCERVRELLLASVAGYVPANGVEDVVWRASQQTETADSVVTDLTSRRTGSGS